LGLERNAIIAVDDVFNVLVYILDDVNTVLTVLEGGLVNLLIEGFEILHR
jgi:hypothetical protein